MKYKPKVEKIWSISTADKKFGDFIKERDGKCVNCGRSDKRLTCSHFWDRRWFSTRFDPLNCDTLCVSCHVFDKDCWEEDRLGEYESFMIRKLGKKKFEELKKKHLVQIKRRDAIIEVMQFLKYPIG